VAVAIHPHIVYTLDALWVVCPACSRIVLVLAALVWSMTTALQSLANGFWALFFLRLVLGISEAFAVREPSSAAYTYVTTLPHIVWGAAIVTLPSFRCHNRTLCFRICSCHINVARRLAHVRSRGGRALFLDPVAQPRIHLLCMRVCLCTCTFLHAIR